MKIDSEAGIMILCGLMIVFILALVVIGGLISKIASARSTKRKAGFDPALTAPYGGQREPVNDSATDMYEVAVRRWYDAEGKTTNLLMFPDNGPGNEQSSESWPVDPKLK